MKGAGPELYFRCTRLYPKHTNFLLHVYSFISLLVIHSMIGAFVQITDDMNTDNTDGPTYKAIIVLFLEMEQGQRLKT